VKIPILLENTKVAVYSVFIFNIITMYSLNYKVQRKKIALCSILRFPVRG